MSLVRYSLTRYRAFDRKVEVELAPITLVIGANHSGKTTLCRAPWFVSQPFARGVASPFSFGDPSGASAPISSVSPRSTTPAPARGDWLDRRRPCAGVRPPTCWERGEENEHASTTATNHQLGATPWCACEHEGPVDQASGVPALLTQVTPTKPLTA